MYPSCRSLSPPVTQFILDFHHGLLAYLDRLEKYAVGEVAKYLGRDQANVSTMLSRLSVRQTRRS